MSQITLLVLGFVSLALLLVALVGFVDFRRHRSITREIDESWLQLRKRARV